MDSVTQYGEAVGIALVILGVVFAFLLRWKQAGAKTQGNPTHGVLAAIDARTVRNTHDIDELGQIQRACRAEREEEQAVNRERFATIETKLERLPEIEKKVDKVVSTMPAMQQTLERVWNKLNGRK